MTIPIVLLTGFLGAGKTTLLRSLLADPALRKTAVLINEVGEIGLDHQLVFGAGGVPTGDAARGIAAALLLANGCVCCTVRDELTVALDDLLVRSRAGELPEFERVIVETTGIADPIPIIDSIASAPLTSRHYALAQVVTVVDASAPMARIEQRRECLAQIVCADTLVISRCDLATEACIAELQALLARLNPRARVLRSTHAGVHHVDLIAMQSDDAHADGARADALAKARALPPAQALGAIADLGAIGPRLHGDLHTSTMRFAGPSVWSQALATIEASLASRDDEVLRVKGVLRLADHPQPMVVQYAGGRISPLEALPGALAEGDAGYLVFIAARRRRAAQAEGGDA